MRKSLPQFTDADILSRRTEKNATDSSKPYAFLVEQERSASGEIGNVVTLFLTNRECPFRCLMCDLWKNTLDQTVQPGEIPQQIQFALSQLPDAKSAREIKLYNSGNFFDRKAIPVEDYAEIASLVRGFEKVIVENHPLLCTDDCLTFRDLIAPAQLEVAIGLETCHPELLKVLNKKMNLDDFERACDFLNRNGIQTRVFLLLKPPFLSEAEGIDWTLRSMQYAFDQGVGCCSIIPTRGGNGMMELLEKQGDFSPPLGSSIESVLELGLSLKRGRVFVDLWDADRFFPCGHCRDSRVDRLYQMNLTQSVLPEIVCEACSK
ncbi:MAG: radical SAM protein [Planctomycetaceae bacterium]|nr:radical SAM protein [Planctomycetaceae bacterium]